MSEDLLDEALKESFPASDPLSYWSGNDTGLTGDQPGARAERAGGPAAPTAG